MSASYAWFPVRSMSDAAAPPLLACLVSLLAGCGGAGDDVEPEPARLVVTAPVDARDAVDRLVLLGDVQGQVEVRVVPQVPERIRVLHVREGDVVAAGDPIATLEADLSSSDLAQAGAALSAAEVDRDRLGAEVARARTLIRSGAISEAQLETLEASLRASEAQVTQLRAGRRAAGVRRAMTVVRAPHDGVVAQLVVEEGDVVGPGVPIASVVQMDRVEVVMRVVESDYVRLATGMEVDVAPTARDDVRRRGTITHVAPVIDRLTRTAAVEVTLDNPDHLLRPGMVAEVSIELERRPDVLMVPSRAVVMTTRTDDDREAAVFVRDGPHARRHPVRLGRRYGSDVEIEWGVEAGDEVVVEGQHLLRDGSLVRVEAPPTASLPP